MKMPSKGKEKVGEKGSSGKRKRGNGDNTGCQKRRNSGVLQFFEDSAYEVDGEESGDDSENGYDSLEDEFNTKVAEMDEPDKAFPLPLQPKEEEMSEEELEKLLAERYKPGSSFVKYAEDIYESKGIFERNAVMSSSQDPTIWKVKCMVGRERHSVFCLMQKYADLLPMGTKLQTVSAFALDHVKGSFYIEADKEADVHQACKALSGIYVSRMEPVPGNEVSHLFTIRSKHNNISEGMWARIKSGIYKGDLAQVVAVNEARKKATVRLIPRIDLQALAEKFGGGITSKKSSPPAPRLISSGELEEFRPLIQYRRDRETNQNIEVLDGMMLKNGYLYKRVSFDSLNFWGAMPSDDELLKFEPSKANEFNDLEWLSDLYSERKKKKPVKIVKGGGKGEGTSCSMEGGFEVNDLVFFGRKDFGVIVGSEKGDTLKVLKDGCEGQVVVSVERRNLKSASFDKKLFSALDANSKSISINDTVIIVEGPLKEKKGIVKQIYKGTIFFHNENEEENSGYFCSKAKLCEKINSSGDLCKGKGGKSGYEDDEDFLSSPKSPLSPDKHALEKDNKYSFNQENDGMFSVGQSLRIRVGPLKGYLCRVLAVRRSDVTVKLDSQQKILSVKSEHLSEVRGRGSSISLGENLGSMNALDLLGSQDTTKDWMNGSVPSTSANWGAGGSSSERSSWPAFPSSSLLPQPASVSTTLNPKNDEPERDVDDSSWDIKVTTCQNSSWGAAVVDIKDDANTGGVTGWGASEGSWSKSTTGGGFGGTASGSWGGAKAVIKDAGESSGKATGSWDSGSGAAVNQYESRKKSEVPFDEGNKNEKSNWDAVGCGGKSMGLWGKEKDGRCDESTGPQHENSWEKVAEKCSKDDPGGRKGVWNVCKDKDTQEKKPCGWGLEDVHPGDVAWGKKNENQTENSTPMKGGNGEAASSWGKNESNTHGEPSWNKQSPPSWNKEGGGGPSRNKQEGGSSKNQEGETSWNKQAGKTSWSKQEGGALWSKQDGGASWNKREGKDSWNKQDGGDSLDKQSGRSSWSKQDSGAAWNKQDDGSTWNKQGGVSGNSGGGFQGHGDRFAFGGQNRSKRGAFPDQGGSSNTYHSTSNDFSKDVGDQTGSWGGSNGDRGAGNKWAKDVAVSWGNNPNVNGNDNYKSEKPDEPWVREENLSKNETSSWNNTASRNNIQDSWGKGDAASDAWGKAAQSLDEGSGVGTEKHSWGKSAGNWNCKDESSESKAVWDGSSKQIQADSWAKQRHSDAEGESTWKKQQAEGSWGKQDGVSWNKQGAESWGSKSDWNSDNKFDGSENQADNNHDGSGGGGWRGRGGRGRSDRGVFRGRGWSDGGGFGGRGGSFRGGFGGRDASDRGGFRGRGRFDRGGFRGRGRGRRDQNSDWRDRNESSDKFYSSNHRSEDDSTGGWKSNEGGAGGNWNQDGSKGQWQSWTSQFKPSTGVEAGENTGRTSDWKTGVTDSAKVASGSGWNSQGKDRTTAHVPGPSSGWSQVTDGTLKAEGWRGSKTGGTSGGWSQSTFDKGQCSWNQQGNGGTSEGWNQSASDNGHSFDRNQTGSDSASGGWIQDSKEKGQSAGWNLPRKSESASGSWSAASNEAPLTGCPQSANSGRASGSWDKSTSDKGQSSGWNLPGKDRSTAAGWNKSADANSDGPSESSDPTDSFGGKVAGNSWGTGKHGDKKGRGW